MLFRSNVMVSQDNIRWLKHDLHVAGLNLQRITDLPTSLQHLLDVQLEVTKRTRGDNENVYFNKRLEQQPIPTSSGTDAIPF